MELVPRNNDLNRLVFACDNMKTWENIQLDKSIKNGVRSLLTEYSPEFYLECNTEDWVWIKLKYAEQVRKTARYKEMQNA